MDDFDCPSPGEYDDVSQYEDKYTDDMDALNDLEEDVEFPVLKTKASKSNGNQRNKQKIHQRSRLRDENNDIDFLDDSLSSEETLASHCSAPMARKKLDNEFRKHLDVSPKNKRQKIQMDDDEEEEEITREAPFEIVTQVVPDFVPKGCHKERKHVYKRPPYGTDSITTTDMEGRRVYLKLKKSAEEIHENEKMSIKKLNLLAVPFAEIKKAIDEKRHEEMICKANVMKDLLKELHEDSEENSEMLEDDTGIVEPDEALWVEKYTPQRFTDLLSDDGTNRVLLKWLKLWDEFVFGKSKAKMKKIKKEKKAQNEQKRFGKRKQTWDYEEELDSDATGRPIFKIALLAGNPGLGKTTLAHIVAKHAGYNPVEMNASDDRSAELFKNKLEAATQMKACMGGDKRPNCLIIDEIDGAPVQAINILLQAAKDTEELSKKKKKNKSQISLTRPVICICNDQYVPALRQLRQIALTLTVPQVSPGRLAQRLLEISRKEKLRADMACLLALCDKSENDIRSCVNTLQFISRKHGALNAKHLQSVTIGQKDFQKGLFFIWKSIFQLPKPSRKPLAFLQHANKEGLGSSNLALSHLQTQIGSSKMQSNNSVRFHNILHLASSNSEYEKMVQGIFDNYLNVKSKDPHLDTVVSCSHWLEFADHIETKIRSKQTFSLMKFYPFLPVAFHMSLAGAMTPKITFNNSMVELNTKTSKSKQLIQGIVHEVRPNVRRIINDILTISDLFPVLYEVIHPVLRPVNVQLYSQSEKQQLLNLVSVMISYNLTYQQEQNFEGQYTYTLHPNLEEIISFPGLAQHKRMTYTAKQLIQREIDLEKMRKVEQSIQEKNSDKKSGNNEKNEKKEKDNRVVKALQPIKCTATKARPVMDFFGRIIKPVEKTAEEKLLERKSSIINTNVWFKFNEGYTNAVRRTIKVQDFL